MIYPTSNITIYDCTLSELRILSTFENNHKKLRKIFDRILQYIGEHYSVSAAEISKELKFSKNPLDYGNAKTHMRKLHSLKFTELDYQKRNNKNENKKSGKHYKLSVHGIYYLISNNRNLPHGLLKMLLINYPNHVLFRFFLYPYLSRNTLLNIADSAIFSHTCLYLNDCCKKMEELFYRIEHIYNSKNGYLTDQLFIWQNIHKVEDDTMKLRNFLIQKFKWDWINKAEIRKTEDGNGIKISYELKSIYISLNNEKTKATIGFRGKKLYELIVRDIGDKLIIEEPTTPIDDECVKLFLTSHQARIPEFIVALISDYGTVSLAPTLKMLGEDKEFMEALKKIKYQFDKRYKLIQKRKKIK